VSICPPFNTVDSPLRYSGNSGVNDLSHREGCTLTRTASRGSRPAALPPRYSAERASERFPVRFRCKMYSIVIQTQYTCCTFGASHLPCVAYTEGCVCHGRRLSDEIYRIRVHYQLVSAACLTGVAGNARSLARSEDRYRGGHRRARSAKAEEPRW
jgi:hypothetical protein